LKTGQFTPEAGSAVLYPKTGITRKARTPDDDHANLFANEAQKSKKAQRAGFSLKPPPIGICEANPALSAINQSDCPVAEAAWRFSFGCGANVFALTCG